MKIKFYMEDGSTPVVMLPFLTPEDVQKAIWPPNSDVKVVSFHGQPRPGRPGEYYTVTINLDRMITAEYPA